MMTVREVSRISGVSVRALHHYDAIGLLPATALTDAGYRLYDEAALERLQQILIYRELQFPLKEIKAILDAPNFERNKALEQQIHLLELRRDHLNNLIDLAKGMKVMGVKTMRFDVFDTKKIDEYAEQAKKSWGTTPEYREFTEKSRSRTRDEEKALGSRMMDIFAEFGGMKDLPADDERVQAQVKKLRDFISEHYYHCSDEILSSLGGMYAGGGSMTENIDAVAGEGTAAFVNRAIRAMIAGKK